MPMSSNVKMKDNDRVGIELATVSGISAFLGKLWKMVEDPKTDPLIAWGQAGTTFVIKNQIDFAKSILPNYYKHNNIASFIRQLNMYGFHKIISTTSGSLDSADNDEIEFSHPNFVRGRPYLLEQIKRKMNNPKENIVKQETAPEFNESIKRVLTDVKQLKGKQEYLHTQLCSVKQENEILWRELSLLRQKHAAQQNILNKLIRFLVSLAQPANHGLVKRRLVPLMLKDSASKVKKGPLIQEGDHVYSMKKCEAVPSGPTIHEIHPSDVVDEVQIVDSPVMEVTSDVSVMAEDELVNSPCSSGNVSSPEPVPAALLRSNRNGKRRIQTVYATQDQQQHIPSHFLISRSPSGFHDAAEYLIPEQTDNPFLELVHETETDDSNDYITVMSDDGPEVLQDSIPAIEVAEVASSSKKSSEERTSRRKAPLTRKRVTKKSNPTPVLTTPLNPQQEIQQPLITVESVLQENKNPDIVRSEDFLFDINLQNEPLIEIQSASANDPSSATATQLPGLKIEVPITVDDVISAAISPCANNANPLNVPVNTGSNVVSPNNLLLSPHNVQIQSPLQPATVSATRTGQITDDQNKSADEAFINQINECIDNAQNMRIACTDNTMPPSKAYVDDISTQLDSMQTDINSLKELMHNEGLTLDVNTLMGLFSEDPMDYNMPSEASADFHKSCDDKIMGNELISAPSMFDFDIFPTEWSQPNTPLSTTESDYCTLNTPQIERRMDDSQLLFQPPNKKSKNQTE